MKDRIQGLAGYALWRLHGRPVAGPDEGYSRWLAGTTHLVPPPRDGEPITIVTPVHDPPISFLERCLASVRHQTYSKVEHVLVDAGCRRRDVLQLLAVHADDAGVKLIRARGGISAATNAGIEASSSPYVGFLDHDDELSPHALMWTAACLPRADIVYSDQDEIDAEGKRSRPFFKPAWSPRLLWSFNYVNHFLCVRRELLADVGGFRSELDGVQDHDLLLRASLREPVVAHVPMILYHWRRWRGTVSLSASHRELDARARDAIDGVLTARGLRFRAQTTEEAFRYRLEPVGGTPPPYELRGLRIDRKLADAAAWWLSDPSVHAAGDGGSTADGVSADALTRFPRERARLGRWSVVRPGGSPDEPAHDGVVVGIPDTSAPDAAPVVDAGWDGTPHVEVRAGRLVVRSPSRISADSVVPRWRGGRRPGAEPTQPPLS